MKTILIVEDDLTMADLLEETLIEDGYRIIGSVQTVQQALDACSVEEPDFAVIDVSLGNGESGTVVGAALRAKTKAMILYSTGNEDDASLSASVGDAVCSKPYRLRDVSRMLEVLDNRAINGIGETALPAKFRLLDET